MTDGDAAGIRAVVFDVGGVFIDWDPNHLYRKLIPDDEERRRFLTEICTPEWHVAHDRGTPTLDSCRALAERHPEHASLIIAWAERNAEMVAATFDESVAILRELRARHVPCYMLSNTESEAYAQRCADYPFMREFDGAVISCEEGVVKPDEEIFRRLLARFALDPAHTVFIDDRQENVEMAARLGFVARRFTTPEDLRRELAHLGLLPAR